MTTSIATLITEIQRAFLDGETLSALFIDIKSAFDYVNPNILQEILIEMRIPIKTRKFVFNLMTNRNLYFKINHEVFGPYCKHIGLPQGCVISAFMYTIYNIKLNQRISIENEIVQFADDTVLINKKKGIKNSLKKLQSDVAKITEYFDSI